jgi:hypothetical protein
MYLYVEQRMTEYSTQNTRSGNKDPGLVWKRNKKYKEIENCFISIQSNLHLLEYICWIV